ncbi:hypothetical protein SAMN05444001_12249, partial [Parabacteroides chinchillae]
YEIVAGSSVMVLQAYKMAAATPVMVL